MLFPSIGNSADVYAHYAQLRTYVLEMCDTLSESLSPDIQRLSELGQFFLKLQTSSRPLNFTSSDQSNIILQMERNFIEACNIMEMNGSTDPHSYTVMQFYAKIDYLQKEAAKVAGNN